MVIIYINVYLKHVSTKIIEVQLMNSYKQNMQKGLRRILSLQQKVFKKKKKKKEKNPGKSKRKNNMPNIRQNQ